jgi:hypothetical protein
LDAVMGDLFDSSRIQDILGQAHHIWYGGAIEQDVEVVFVEEQHAANRYMVLWYRFNGTWWDYILFEDLYPTEMVYLPAHYGVVD